MTTLGTWDVHRPAFFLSTLNQTTSLVFKTRTLKKNQSGFARQLPPAHRNPSLVGLVRVAQPADALSKSFETTVRFIMDLSRKKVGDHVC